MYVQLTHYRKFFPWSRHLERVASLNLSIVQLETSSLGLTHSPPSYKGPQCVFGYHSQAYRENTAFSSKGRTFSKRPYLKSKSAVFTVVKHLLKRDENDKRTYQSDERTFGPQRR